MILKEGRNKQKRSVSNLIDHEVMHLKSIEFGSFYLNGLKENSWEFKKDRIF